jgi:hypothetical protein
MRRFAEGEEREEAWNAAKLAVRAYARNPSDTNANNVKAAWHKVRDLDANRTRRWMATRLEGRPKT